jgi:hypothetical protein
LRLLKNSTRINTGKGDNDYPRNTDEAGLPADDPRFVETNVPVKAIATSSGQNDSGVFELSFRDERYVPFEGAGAISAWSLELFSDPVNADFGRPLRQFDYGSITDAVLHVRYTARDDAGTFKNEAVAHLREYFRQDGATPSFLMLDLRRDFATQWSRFLRPANPANGNVFELELSADRVPMRDAGKTIKINTITILARCSDPGNYAITLDSPLAAPGSTTLALIQAKGYGGLHVGRKDVAATGLEIAPAGPPLVVKIKMTRPTGKNLTEDPITKVMEVADVVFVLGYGWE